MLAEQADLDQLLNKQKTIDQDHALALTELNQKIETQKPSEKKIEIPKTLINLLKTGKGIQLVQESAASNQINLKDNFEEYGINELYHKEYLNYATNTQTSKKEMLVLLKNAMMKNTILG